MIDIWQSTLWTSIKFNGSNNKHLSFGLGKQLLAFDDTTHLCIGNWITYGLINLMAKAINYRVPNHKEYIWFPIFEMKNIGHFLIIQESKIHLIPFTLDRILHYIIHFYNHKKITFTKFFAIALIDEQNLILAFLNFSKNHQIHVKFFDCKNGKKKNVGSILNMKYECIWWAYWICIHITYYIRLLLSYLIKPSNFFVRSLIQILLNWVFIKWPDNSR